VAAPHVGERDLGAVAAIAADARAAVEAAWAREDEQLRRLEEADGQPRLRASRLTPQHYAARKATDYLAARGVLSSVPRRGYHLPPELELVFARYPAGVVAIFAEQGLVDQNATAERYGLTGGYWQLADESRNRRRKAVRILRERLPETRMGKGSLPHRRATPRARTPRLRASRRVVRNHARSSRDDPSEPPRSSLTRRAAR
jgi:hypothetical protein